MLDPRWDSRDSLLRSIRELVTRADGTIHRLGRSDCFEIQIEGQQPTLLALKETGKDLARHKEAQTNWIGVPDQFLARLLELGQQGLKPRGLFLLIDYWDNHLIIISSQSALGTMLHRSRKGTQIHLSFNVKKTLQGYSVQTSLGEPDIELADVDTLRPLEALLLLTR